MALLVNGELISDDDFRQEFVRVSGGAPVAAESMAHLQRVAEQNVVHRRLLVQVARQRGLAVSSAEIDAERHRQWQSENNSICGAGIRKTLAEGLLIEKLREEVSRYVPRPSRAAVEACYRENPALFWKPERALVAHIVKNVERVEDEPQAMAQMELAAIELSRGKSFAAVADRFSDCKGNGGSLGWVERGSMVSEFEAVVYSLQKRQRSSIFRSVFGLHIVELQDRKDAGLQPFDEVRIELARRLHEEQRQRMLDQVLAAAISQAQITPVSAAGQAG